MSGFYSELTIYIEAEIEFSLSNALQTWICSR